MVNYNFNKSIIKASTLKARNSDTTKIIDFFIYIHKCEGGYLKRAHLAITHSQEFFKVFLRGIYMSPPGVALSNWKCSNRLATKQNLQIMIDYQLICLNLFKKFCYKLYSFHLRLKLFKVKTTKVFKLYSKLYF